MKKLFSIIVLIFGTFSVLTAQEIETGKIFPTRLFLTAGRSDIQLSWKPADKGETGYVIYRHIEQIGPENLSKAAKIGETALDGDTFLDSPPSPEISYYYAVLAVDSSGELQDIFIPFANINPYGVSVLYTSEEELSIALISQITTETADNTVRISFSSSRPGREILVYRNTSPILSHRDLLNAILLAGFPSDRSEYIDFPIRGVDYYYALIDSLSLKSGNILLQPGKNTSTRAVFIPLKDSGEVTAHMGFSLRPRPLPYLSSGMLYQNNRSLSGISLDDYQPLSESVQDKLGRLLNTLDPRPLPDVHPVLLEADRNSGAPGEDPRLTAILTSELLSRNYETAGEMLRNYSMLPRSKEVEFRLHFYLGQIHYFLGNYQEALIEFLFAEEKYHGECRPFLQNIFRMNFL